MLYFLQQLLNGFHSGALYALLAFGYVLTNGVLKRTNLAHGPVFAFAGQVLILVAVFGWQVLWLTLPATVALGIVSAFVYAALIATVLSRSVFIPLAESSPNAIVVATLGVALVLMELARIAADTRDFWLPPMLAEPVVMLSANGFLVTLTVIQLVNCGLAVVVIALAGQVLSRSRLRTLLASGQRRSGCRRHVRRRCTAASSTPPSSAGRCWPHWRARWRRFITATSASAAEWSTG